MEAEGPARRQLQLSSNNLDDDVGERNKQTKEMFMRKCG